MRESEGQIGNCGLNLTPGRSAGLSPSALPKTMRTKIQRRAP